VTAAQSVTWIKVEHPQFDLFGVLVSSLQMTGGLLVLALVFGSIFGLVLLWRRRRDERPPEARVALSLQLRS
jgi:hypothetical protein